mgnify:CR=1 FL=1|jgi:hypothetical protein
MKKKTKKKVLPSSFFNKFLINNKKGIELSINFTIILILAIFMFGSGIIIIQKIFFQAEEMKKALSNQQRENLERIMREGTDKIQTAYIKKELHAGEHEVFGIGIRNDFENERKFYIEQNCDAFIINNEIQCDDDTIDDCNDYDNLLINDDEHINIKPNDNVVNDIFINIPKNAAKGTYVFNVRVCYRDLSYTLLPGETGCKTDGTNQYSTTKKFNIIVN